MTLLSPNLPFLARLDCNVRREKKWPVKDNRLALLKKKQKNETTTKKSVKLQKNLRFLQN